MRVYMDLHKRLLQCHDIADRMFAERDRAVAAFLEVMRQGQRSLPFAINLDVEAESFLLASKQYLRDLVKALNLLLDAKLPMEAAIFWDRKGRGESKVVEWATAKFGADHPTTAMFIEEDGWIAELVKKRNAVEHPNGYSGALIFENYKLMPEGQDHATDVETRRKPERAP